MDKHVKILLRDLQDLVNDTIHNFTRGLSQIYKDYENNPDKMAKLYEGSEHYRQTEPLVRRYFKENEDKIRKYATPAKTERIAKSYPEGYGSEQTILWDLTREYMEKEGLI